MKPEHADNVPFLVETRFGDRSGGSPEEFLGAALAGCYAMALASELEQAGFTPVSVRTDASVQLEREADGLEIVRIDLAAEVRAPDADDARLRLVVEEATRRACPIARALKSVPLYVTAKLVGAKAQPSLGRP